MVSERAQLEQMWLQNPLEWKPFHDWLLENDEPLEAKRVRSEGLLPKQIVFPRAVIIDSREQAGYAFTGLRGDVRQGRLPLVIPTLIRGLKSGDYSLDGFEDQVAVERKSLHDLYNTLGQGRARFQRELQRLADMRLACVVVEAEWSEILNHPPPHSKLLPKTIFRSVLAWVQRYPSIHWLMMPGRTVAERTTFRILERFYKETLKRASK